MEEKGKFHSDRRFKKSNKKWKDNEKYKKFVGNREEGQGFADKRKKKIQHEYLQMIRKDKRKGQSPAQTATYRRDEDEIQAEQAEERRQEERAEQRKSYIFNRKPNSQSTKQSGRESQDFTQTPFDEVQDTNNDRLSMPEKSEANKNSSVNHQRKFRQENHRNFNKRKDNVFSRAMHEANTRRDEAQKRREQIEKEKKEKDTALQNYRKNKRQNYFKYHCKRTSKGQPVMKYQMELLLQKIEKQREKDNK